MNESVLLASQLDSDKEKTAVDPLYGERRANGYDDRPCAARVLKDCLEKDDSELYLCQIAARAIIFSTAS
jgi:hypothetical protein